MEINLLNVEEKDKIVESEQLQDPRDEKITNEKIQLDLDDEFFKNEGTLNDEGELSELANELDVSGSNNLSIVGSKIILGDIDEDDTTYPCPECLSEIDASKYGKIICPICGFKIYRRNSKLEITQFSTLEDKILASKYRDVIAHINNNLIRKKYVASFKYCLEAEQLAPREPTTWEYYTLVSFYNEIGISKENRLHINDILRLVRNNIHICEANNVEINKIEEIKGIIGIYLFNLAKSKIGSYYHKSKKQPGYWSLKGRQLTINYLKLFEECFKLTGDSNYLHGYVDELSKPYKWIVKSFNGNLINLPACGNYYNAVSQRNKIIKTIEKYEKDYIPPEIESERISIAFENDVNEENKIIISFQ